MPAMKVLVNYASAEFLASQTLNTRTALSIGGFDQAIAGTQ